MQGSDCFLQNNEELLHEMSRYSLTSSANNLTEQSLIASQISLMKIKNKIGPSTLPWGTSLSTAIKLE